MKSSFILFTFLLSLFPNKSVNASHLSFSKEIKRVNLLTTPEHIVLKTDSLHLIIKGTAMYDLVLTSISKDEYDTALKNENHLKLDKTIIPSQVTITQDCYMVSAKNKIVKQCLNDDEQLLGLSYVGFIKEQNICVVQENWFETTTDNILINIEDGTNSYITGYDLLISPDAKFIYSYANDGIDFDGISFHYFNDNKVNPIFISDYETEDIYNFDFTTLGEGHWVSNKCMVLSNTNAYYQIEIIEK